MPFKSEAQRRYLWSQKPEVARKFAKDEKMLGASPSFNIGDMAIWIDSRGKEHKGQIIDSRHNILMNETSYRFKDANSPTKRSAFWTSAARLRKA